MLENRHVVSVVIADPAADRKVNILRVPTGHTYTIEKAYAVADRVRAADATDYYSVSLENGGTAGTGTTAIGGTAGGTAGWVANTPQEITITSGSGDLTAGQWLNASYDEEGTVAPGNLTVCIEFVDGIGSKA
jgi:hypothetical protein